MSFDIDKTIDDMTAAAAKTAEGSSEIAAYARQVLEGEKKTLKNLAELRISGDLTEEEFASELADEQKTIEAQLLALKAMKKAVLQKIVNAAVGALVSAVKSAVS